MFVSCAAASWHFAVTAAIYAPTLHYGFTYDDYYLVKPYSSTQIRAAFVGHWDPDGIMVPFYRPLAVAFHALRFELFHHDAWSYHAMSLALFALASMLFGVVVWRLTDRVATALAAVVLFTTHPAFVYSLVAWTTNQMHLLQTLVCFGSVLCWWQGKKRSTIYWTPLLVAQLIAFGLKEDGLMLLPFILFAHLACKWLVDRETPWPPVTVLAAGALLIVSLIAWRHESLGGIGGYHMPTWEHMRSNLWWGPHRIFFQIPAHRPGQALLGWLVPIVTLLGAAVALLRPTLTSARFCLVTGFLMTGFFNLPFAFITKPEQLYLVAAGLVLMVVGSWDAILATWSRPAYRAAQLAVLGTMVAAMVIATRDTMRDFHPYATLTLKHDAIVREWVGKVSPEVLEYLQEKEQRWANGRQTVPPSPSRAIITYGLHDWENRDRDPYRWTTGEVTAFVSTSGPNQLQVPVRNVATPEALGTPILQIFVDGTLAERVPVTSSRWQSVSVALPASRGGRAHRLDLRISPTWVPRDYAPGSQDPRVLGIQVGPLTLTTAPGSALTSSN